MMIRKRYQIAEWIEKQRVKTRERERRAPVDGCRLSYYKMMVGRLSSQSKRFISWPGHGVDLLRAAIVD